MPELRQLRTFVAVAEQTSFTRAGEIVHLRQQSVSKAVRELERELGVELLERTTREVRLTAAGRVLLKEGKRALEVTDAAFARTREVGSGLAGTTASATPPRSARPTRPRSPKRCVWTVPTCRSSCWRSVPRRCGPCFAPVSLTSR